MSQTPSAGELVDVGAEVAALCVAAAGAAFDYTEELEEHVVARVRRRAAVVDQQLEPDLPGILEQPLAVRPERLVGAGGQAQDRERAVPVVGHLEVLRQGVEDLGERLAGRQ